MTCPACAAAQTNKHHALYQADCQGCTVRGLAKSRGFFESARIGKIARYYHSALKTAFKDPIKGHELVKAEAKRLEAMN